MSSSEQIGVPQIHVEAARLLERFGRLPNHVQTGVVRGLRRGLLLTEDNVRNWSEVRFSGARSGLLSRLTSRAAKDGSGMDADAVIGFRRTRGFPYELSQEFGARARAGGAMAIPRSDEARRLSQEGRGPRDMDAKLVLRSTGGRAYLFERIGKGKIQVHYILVKSIRPRLNFRQSVQRSRHMIMREVVQEARNAQRRGA